METSAGIVVYNPSLKKYLVLHYEEGHWDLPKGHVEKGESLKEAAVRETLEETGLKVDILDGFREKIDYWYTWQGKKRHKQVIFFAGFINEEEIALSHEHIGYEWLRYVDAVAQLTYDNAKEILKKANDFYTKY